MRRSTPTNSTPTGDVTVNANKKMVVKQIMRRLDKPDYEMELRKRRATACSTAPQSSSSDSSDSETGNDSHAIESPVHDIETTDNATEIQVVDIGTTAIAPTESRPGVAVETKNMRQQKPKQRRLEKKVKFASLIALALSAPAFIASAGTDYMNKSVINHGKLILDRVSIGFSLLSISAVIGLFYSLQDIGRVSKSMQERLIVLAIISAVISIMSLAMIAFI